MARMVRTCTLALVLAGCASDAGGGDPIGTFLVDADVASPCATDEPVADPTDRLVVAPLGVGVTVEPCRDELPSCDPILTLADAVAAGFAGTDASAQSFENGRVCELAFRELALTVRGDRLTLDITTHSTQLGFGSACTIDEAVARGTAMPCARHERITATRE